MKTFLQSVPFSCNSIITKIKKRIVPSLKSLTLIVFILGLHFTAIAQPGAALDFNGAANNVALPNLIPSGSYTKEAWINARSFAIPINTSNGGNIVSGIKTAFWAPEGKLSAGHNFTNTNLQDPTAMTVGIWYHVAVTYDAGTNSMILYRDGLVVAGPASPGTAPFAETEQYIGAYNNGLGPQYQWDGQIDEVRIWNVVRTPAEINATRNCELTGDEPGLLAYYNFNQGTAGGSNPAVTTLNDGSDKCTPLNNGTLVGFALTGATSNWVAPGPTLTGPCASIANIAVTGNAVCIIDGDGTPSGPDDTDFGTGNPVTRTFTINNTGNATLNITNVAISGANASEFSATQPVSLTVPGGGSTTFTVTFTAATNGVKNAIVTVNSDDGDEAAYDFAVTASFFTLPVDMKLFNVQKNGSQSRLSWTTATETGNKGFEIQRSKDGNNWKMIGFVAGAGTTTAEQRYSYADAAPQKGRNYYRLKQLDIDNRAKFSEVRSATFADQYTLVYPVPTKDKVMVELKDQKLIGTQAVLSDQYGRILQRITVTKMQQPVSLENLSAGIYFLKMNDGESHKLIKQ
jgi:Concanavalin A-like lectin/glucanases superfamily/Secretion system C-terminal sorting domain